MLQVTNMRIKRSKTKGVTLAELLIAVSILIVVIGPVLGMFMWSSQASIKAYKISIAAVVAEMRMEELVGAEFPPARTKFEDKGFTVIITYENMKLEHLDEDLRHALDKEGTTMPISQFADFLKMVTVTVYDNDYDNDTNKGTVLCIQRNVINIAPNGFFSEDDESE